MFTRLTSQLRIRAWAVPALMVGLLSLAVACGGGGGSTAAPAPTPNAPVITTQPISKIATAPATTSFSVVATGSGTLSYQWHKNGVAIAGATADIYTTTATSTSDNGAKFKVVVSNANGSVTSSEVTLWVHAATQPPVGSTLGSTAAEFTATNWDNTPFKLSDHRGKVILLDFSAGWCGPCRSEAGHLEAMYQKYKAKGFIIVTALIQGNTTSTPSTLTDLSGWKTQYALTFPVTNDPAYAGANAYAVSSIPHNVIIDQNFVIRRIIVGSDAAGIEAAVASLVP